MDWTEGDLVWFDPGLGHPLPGEIHEVHRAAQVIIVQAVINGKVSYKLSNLTLRYHFFQCQGLKRLQRAYLSSDLDKFVLVQKVFENLTNLN